MKPESRAAQAAGFVDPATYALWTWVVAEHPDGALVTVAGELHPQTFWRRVLFVRIRARQLGRTELPRSLAALEGTVRLSRNP